MAKYAGSYSPTSGVPLVSHPWGEERSEVVFVLSGPMSTFAIGQASTKASRNSKRKMVRLWRGGGCLARVALSPQGNQVKATEDAEVPCCPLGCGALHPGQAEGKQQGKRSIGEQKAADIQDVGQRSAEGRAVL